MFDIQKLYRQEFTLYACYKEGKLTKKQYLAYMKPLDNVISKLELATLQGIQVSKKASL